jgi:DNA modification methylase
MRLLALQKLGWTEAPVVYEDLPAKEEDLRRLRDNASYGEDDDQAIAELLYHLKEQEADLSLTGLDDAAVSKLLDSVSGEGMPGADDADLTPPEEPTTKPGDLWILGEHRIVCGDCADPAVVTRLMAGRTAALMTTDPPYGVDYASLVESRENQKAGGWDDIHNDALDDDALLSLLTAALGGAGATTAFVWHPAGARRFLFWQALETNGWRIAQEIVWVKNALVFGRADYQWRHEPCLYAKKAGAPAQGDRTQTTVWEESKTTHAEHPTQKPVGLYERPIKNHTQRGDLVYDPFLGSGTALVAAEGLGRICYGVELEPRYCDVVIRRWEHLTGKTATLEPRKEG